MKLTTMRVVLWSLVAVVGLGAAGATVFLRQPTEAASTFGQGTYNLLDQTGAAVDQTIFQNHPSVLFFGFTHCPDVCPTTLAEMSAWFETLGDEGKNLHAYFVTVDPERDTPAVLGEYVSWVSDRITGLTGTQAEIDKVVKAWGVYAAKVPLEDGDYTMDHTASVFLLDSKGAFQGTIAYGENSDTAIGKLRNLLAKS